MRRRFAPHLLVIAFVLSACSSPSTGGPGDFLVAKVSGPLPSMAGTTLTGATLSPADYRGHVVVINFWNPDCPPCRKEAPELETQWQRLRSLGVRFVGVVYVGGNWPDDPSAARTYVRDYGLDYPSIVDGRSSIARAAAIQGIPETIVADSSGQMRYRVLGGVKPGELVALITGLSPSP